MYSRRHILRLFSLCPCHLKGYSASFLQIDLNGCPVSANFNDLAEQYLSRNRSVAYGQVTDSDWEQLYEAAVQRPIDWRRYREDQAYALQVGRQLVDTLIRAGKVVRLSEFPHAMGFDSSVRHPLWVDVPQFDLWALDREDDPSIAIFYTSESWKRVLANPKREWARVCRRHGQDTMAAPHRGRVIIRIQYSERDF